jgi:hypothetical protein
MASRKAPRKLHRVPARFSHCSKGTGKKRSDWAAQLLRAPPASADPAQANPVHSGHRRTASDLRAQVAKAIQHIQKLDIVPEMTGKRLHVLIYWRYFGILNQGTKPVTGPQPADLR